MAKVSAAPASLQLARRHGPRATQASVRLTAGYFMPTLRLLMYTVRL
jgi:hypothetical protein